MVRGILGVSEIFDISPLEIGSNSSHDDDWC